MGTNEFDVSNLRVLFSDNVALDGISLKIEVGSMNFLLGANGSGKSTLIKCLAGHLVWTSGDILRRGECRKSDRPNFNRGLHLISEEVSPPAVSLGHLKRLYQSLYEKWDEVLFQRLLTWGQLHESNDLQEVSRGQRVQGLLALALATSPEVLLIDEATAVLDPFIRNRLMTEIETLNQTLKTTVLIATNIATEVALLRGRLLIMQQGRILTDKAASRVAEGFQKIRVAPEYLSGLHNPYFTFLEKNTDGSFVFLGQAADLDRVGVPYQLDRRTITIDEVFIYLSDRRAA